MRRLSRVSRRATGIDRAVGAVVRDRRRSKGLSQAALGEAVGLTFRQIRKYEQGTNRISAGMLHLIAEALNCEVIDLFAGLPQPKNGYALSINSEMRALASLFHRIDSAPRRRALINLVNGYADSSQNSASLP